MLGKSIPERAEFAKDETFVKMYSDSTKDITPRRSYHPSPSISLHDYSIEAKDKVKSFKYLLESEKPLADGIVSV